MRFKKYIISAFALFLIIIVAVILAFKKNSMQNNSCVDKIDLNEIYLSINSYAQNSFEIADDNSAMNYISLNFNKLNDYIFAIKSDNAAEYFLLIKDIDKGNKDTLESFVKLYNKNKDNKSQKVIINTHKNITYVSFSPEYTSSIDGIVRSYVYCK